VIVAGASNGNFDQGVYDSIVIGGSTAADGDQTKSNGVPFTQKADATNLSGMGGLQYDFSDDVMGYATYARGYKGPGLNVFFNLRTNGTPPLAPELGDSFEAGLKTSLFDKKLTFNVAAFYAKYRNFQANNPDFVLGQRVTRFSNAGTISTRGVEAEFLYRPNGNFNLGGGITYTDARVDAFRLPPGGNAADLIPNGTQLAFAPTWKGSLGGSYTVRTGGFADVELGAQSSWQSSQISLFVGNPLLRNFGTIRPYALVDLSVALVEKDDGWRLSFVARNLFDKSFAASIADGGPLARGDSGLSSFVYIIPREADRYFGVQGRINF
jgi:iron complex outermembrane receptor protein